ncbi:MAG: 3-keto-disaccharide hydrolase [Bacteroidales bacterium]
MKTFALLLSMGLMLFISSCSQLNKLTREEMEEGWVLLFDGKTTTGWKSFNEDTLTGWIVEDGCLVGLGLGGDIGGDIVTVAEYGNFILKWEWKLGPHGNSGVMYHVLEGDQFEAPYETGPEYQLIEDDDFRENGETVEIEEWQKTAADYAMYIPPEDKELHTREWNSSMIMFTGEKAEYWLNGKKTVEFVPWSNDWFERRKSGKWDAYPDYGLAKKGKIALQDHGSKVWFRNIKIQPL